MPDSTVAASIVPDAPKCLLLLCGLPAAGKTSLSKALVRYVTSLQTAGACEVPGIVHICFDDFVEHQHPGSAFDPAAWKVGRRRAMSHLAAALAPAGSKGPANLEIASSCRPARRLLVIADDNMHLRSMRRQVRRLAAEQGVAFLLLYLRCPPGVALARNAARPPGFRVPDAVLGRMSQVFEEPSGAEAGQQLPPLDVQSVSWESAHLAQLARGLWRLVLAAWGPPQQVPPEQGDAEQREASRSATAASATHQLDIRSRGVIAAALAVCPASLAPAQKAQLAAALNARRRDMMDRFRANQGGTDAVDAVLREFGSVVDETVIELAMASLNMI